MFTLLVQYVGDDEASYVDEFESVEDAVDYAISDPDIEYYQVYDKDGEIVEEN